MRARLIIAMPNGFDLNGSTAAHTIRWGYYHGAKRAGLDSWMVQYQDLPDFAEAGSIYWLTYDDYRFLDDDTLNLIRQHTHIVEVNVWFDGMEELHRRYNAPNPTIPDDLKNRILSSEPDFVWCSAPEAYLEYYQGWADAGMKVVSLPWACDVERYNWPYALPRFSDDTEIAYVGGYRDYKESQYAERLWPYEDRLKVWGYNEWPRCYHGHLPNEDERILYGQARLCPTLSEPQFYVTGDTVERPFKIMGSGGLTILDMPCYYDLFTTDEALIAPDLDTYHWMVNKVLTDVETCVTYREAGHRAVLERHTYEHRVETILKEVGL